MFLSFLILPILEVQHFGLFCIFQFAHQKCFFERIWQAFSLNFGVTPLRHLASSNNPQIKALAKRVMELLQIRDNGELRLTLPSSEDIEPLYSYHSESFKPALNCPEFSDVTFVVEGKHIFAHKVILATKCPIFKAMFASGLQESKKKEIAIDNVQYDIFLEILTFIYTNKAPNMCSSTAVQLLICADMYLLEDLKLHIQYFLEDFVEIDNCCEMLDIADQFSCERLFETVINFIQKNYEKIAKLETFQCLGEYLKSQCANPKKKVLFQTYE